MIRPLDLYQKAVRAGLEVMVRDGRVGVRGPLDEHADIVHELRVNRDLIADLLTCSRHDGEARKPLRLNPGIVRCPVCEDEWTSFERTNGTTLDNIPDSVKATRPWLLDPSSEQSSQHRPDSQRGTT